MCAEHVARWHQPPSSRAATQVVQVCAEHKKPAKLLKHLAAIKARSAAMRNPPLILIFANRIKVRAGVGARARARVVGHN